MIIASASLVAPKRAVFEWAYIMVIKPFSLKELLTGLMLPFLSRWTSLGRESPFHHKVVYSVNNGRSLRQKSIHHERENTMLFSSIRVVNGRPFLHCSIVWWQTFIELIIELSSKILWVKINVFLHWENVDVSCTKNLLVSSTPSPDQMPGY